MMMLLFKYLRASWLSILIECSVAIICLYWALKLLFQTKVKQFKSTSYPQHLIEKTEGREVIIVGAGVVGSSLAVALGKQGRKVTIVERSFDEPNRMVGELLQPGGVEQIEALGLTDCLENIDAPKVTGYVVLNNGQEIMLNYPSKKNSEERFIGRSFHHGRFVQKLRAAVRSCDNVTMIEAAVTSLVTYSKNEKEEQAQNHNNQQLQEEEQVVGVTIKEKGQQQKKNIYAPLVIACDGINSRFRKEIYNTNNNENKPHATSSFCGIELHNVKLPHDNKGHVILMDPAPVLVYPISSNSVRLLVDVPHPLPASTESISKSEALKQYFKTKIVPQLPETIKASLLDYLSKEKSQIRSMLCSSLHSNNNVDQKLGLICCGDSLNMRHPLTGGGMTVGLSDVVLLSNILKSNNITSFHDQSFVQHQLHQFFKQRIFHACSINVLARALYGVFSIGDPIMVYMREACFAYFNLNDKVIENGPVALLAGTNRNPFSLIFHFIIVAILSAYIQLFPFPSMLKLKLVVTIFMSACKLLVPLLYHEGFFSLLVN